MTKIHYSDPSDGCTYSGYHSIEVETNNGEVLAEYHLAPELMPDLSDPSDFREIGETIVQVADALADDEGGATDE